jgi:hypothetical protein
MNLTTYIFEGSSTIIEDAMAMNQIVIAADLEVNIEQLGEKRFYFNSKDSTDLSVKLNEICNNEEVIIYNYLNTRLDFANNFISCLR